LGILVKRGRERWEGYEAKYIWTNFRLRNKMVIGKMDRLNY
jgi:hypothetical protein